MPLLKIHVVKDVYTSADLDVLMETVHQAIVTSFQVPMGDRYQVLTAHRADHFRALDTGLGFERSDRVILIEIFSRQRTREQKCAFYQRVFEQLSDKLGLHGNDLMMTFQINGDEDWSFRNGVAQFLTGELS
jgi:5-carboxymethyl-2-hydroxymuconate isomerase